MNRVEPADPGRAVTTRLGSLLAAAVLAGLVAVPAGGLGRTGVQGHVTNVARRPIVRALISVRSLDRPPRPVPDLGVFSNAQGHYRWPLRAGRYALTATARGYLRQTRTVTVTAGRLATLDFTLRRRA